MSVQRYFPVLISFLILITISFGSIPSASAQEETPYDLVDAVNNLRALYGLAPYQVDPELMEYAQEHSEYQASIQKGTHTHSDGSLPQDVGLEENVANGDAGVISVAIVVNEIWVDWGHRHILIDYPSGEIGAGIASSSNGQIFYTVDIRAGEETGDGTGTAATSQGTQIPVIRQQTSTPNPNGSILHVVSNGESLWSIAELYSVTVDELKQFNNLAGDSPIIYTGQELLVHPASTATSIFVQVTPPAQSNQLSGTRTITGEANLAPEIPSLEGTAIPSQLVTGTPSETASGETPKDLRLAMIILLVLSGLGLLLLIASGFRRSQNDSD